HTAAPLRHLPPFPTRRSSDLRSSSSTTTTFGPPPPGCGNDILEPGEECDGTGCPAGNECVDCRCVASPVCGNGIIEPGEECDGADRKSTRLNSSHLVISYAVF